MAVTLVGQAEITDQLTSLRTVSKPVGVVSTDYVALFLTRWDSGGSFPAVTGPTGATLRGTVVNGAVETKVYLVAVGSDILWSCSWSGARWSSLSALFFRGVDPAITLSSAPFNTATGSGTSVSTTSVTTAAGAGLAWNVNTQDYASATTHVQPTGYTEVYDFDAYDTAYKIAVGSSESAASATISTSQIWIAALVALAAPSAGGAVALDAKGSTGGQGAGTAVVTRPVAGSASTTSDGPGSLAAARPIAGQATSAAGTTAAAGAARAIAGSATAGAATSGDALFDRGLAGKQSTAAGAGSSLIVDRPMLGQGTAAVGSMGSLLGGIGDLNGSAPTAAATTAAATFTRGFDGFGYAASESVGSSTAVARGVIGDSRATSDMSGSMDLTKTWYRLVVPQIVERFPFPGTNGAMTTRLTREVTVFGDENGLFTSEQGSIPEGGDEYGAIPFGTRYIWYGGHENLTDDPAIKNLWLTYGFEVESVQV